MDERAKQSSMIKEVAARLGFDGCGISHAEKLDDDARHLNDWLRSNYHGTMSYMENHAEKRVDPTLLVDGAQSVISVILNYYSDKKQEDPEAPVISKYAYGNDYHDVVRGKLKQLLGIINSEITPVKGRGFVDSAPVLDRAWAARAGLGWIGKNSNLISPAKGSFFFIGTLIVDIPLHYDRPIPDFCGDCNRCIMACPTGAIIASRIIDSRRCISYLTIENRGKIDEQFKDQFKNRVFGCDICQDVCPWNRKAIPHKEHELMPLKGLLGMKKEEWYRMDEEKYKQMFSDSAVMRAKFSGLKRNLDYLDGQESGG